MYNLRVYFTVCLSTPYDCEQNWGCYILPTFRRKNIFSSYTYAQQLVRHPFVTSAKIASGYFFNIVAGFFRFDSTIIMALSFLE